MDQAGAAGADALDQAARRVRLVGRVEEAVLERGGAAVDDEDLLRPLAFQTQAVRIVALAKRRRRLGRVGHHLLETIGDGPGDVLHRAGVGHDGRLEDGDRNPQHLAARFGNEIGHGLVAAHQRHFAKRIAGLETPDDLALAAVAGHGDRQVAFEQHAQEAGVLTEFDDGFVGFVGDDARLLHQLVQAIVGEMFAEADPLLQELDQLGMFHGSSVSPELVSRVEHREDVLRRHVRLDVVDLVEHVAAAGAEDLQPLLHVLANLLRRARCRARAACRSRRPRTPAGRRTAASAAPGPCWRPMSARD